MHHLLQKEISRFDFPCTTGCKKLLSHVQTCFMFYSMKISKTRVRFIMNWSIFCNNIRRWQWLKGGVLVMLNMIKCDLCWRRHKVKFSYLQNTPCQKFLINVAPKIKAAPGKFGKNDKYVFFVNSILSRLINAAPPNKGIARGKFSKNY